MILPLFFSTMRECSMMAAMWTNDFIPYNSKRLRPSESRGNTCSFGVYLVIQTARLEVRSDVTYCSMLFSETIDSSDMASKWGTHRRQLGCFVCLFAVSVAVLVVFLFLHIGDTHVDRSIIIRWQTFVIFEKGMCAALAERSAVL